MHPLVRHCLCALLPALAAASSARPQVRPQVRIAIERVGLGWSLRYEFATAAPVWYFERSRVDWADGLPWRPRSLLVTTPGVSLGRAGSYDTLTRSDGQPLTRVSFRLIPYTKPLRADYRPALSFSDGGTALYGGEFLVRPAPSVAVVAGLSADPTDGSEPPPSTTLNVRAPGKRILADGKVSRDHASVRLADNTAYIYVGKSRPTGAVGSMSVVDPGLPRWLGTELESLLPRLMELYSDRLRPPGGSAPAIIVAWQGAEKDGYSQSGGVIGNMVALSLSGRTLETTTPKAARAARHLFAHELAHLWLGNIVDVPRRADAWITEGGADFLASRALETLVPGYDARADFQDGADECLRLNGPGQALAEAEARGAFRAHYACGAMLFLALESASHRTGPASTGFQMVRDLIDRHRATGEIDGEAWLAALAAVGGKDARSAAVAVLGRGAEDPTRSWSRLFDITGVRHHVAANRIVID